MRPALLALALLSTAPALRAQPLVAGTWTGVLVPARGERLPVEAAMEECMEGWKARLKVDGRDAGEAQGVAWTEDRLRFRFVEPRTRRAYACTLAPRTEGALEGTCAAPRVRPATLWLRPPASAAFGCSE